MSIATLRNKNPLVYQDFLDIRMEMFKTYQGLVLEYNQLDGIKDDPTRQYDLPEWSNFSGDSPADILKDCEWFTTKVKNIISDKKNVLREVSDFNNAFMASQLQQWPL